MYCKWPYQKLSDGELLATYLQRSWRWRECSLFVIHENVVQELGGLVVPSSPPLIASLSKEVQQSHSLCLGPQTVGHPINDCLCFACEEWWLGVR
jgi:hypothetical protein